MIIRHPKYRCRLNTPSLYDYSEYYSIQINIFQKFMDANRQCCINLVLFWSEIHNDNVITSILMWFHLNKLIWKKEVKNYIRRKKKSQNIRLQLHIVHAFYTINKYWMF